MHCVLLVQVQHATGDLFYCLREEPPKVGRTTDCMRIPISIAKLYTAHYNINILLMHINASLSSHLETCAMITCGLGLSL